MLKLILLGMWFVHGAESATNETYLGEAKSKSGQIAYYEKHDVTFLTGKAQTAKTVYLNADKKVIAEMTSDFRKNLTLPDYEFKDLRDGSSHGIRIENEKIVLWRKKKDSGVEEKFFDTKKFRSSDFVVGCQGLHYYLISNLDGFSKKPSVPVKYMMPGALDFYSFTLKSKKEDEQFIHLSLSIDSLILKMFVSSLEMTYRKSDLRLVKYAGLSNIVDDRGETQYVTIDYQYPGVAK